MDRLLNEHQIPLRSLSLGGIPGETTRFILINDCVLLKAEAELNDHLSLENFLDRTGFEAFVNHLHIQFDGSAASLRSCISFADQLRDDLAAFNPFRKFEVVLSVSDNASTVRFYQIRPLENWLPDDLDAYKGEGILVLT